MRGYLDKSEYTFDFEGWTGLQMVLCVLYKTWNCIKKRFNVKLNLSITKNETQWSVYSEFKKQTHFSTIRDCVFANTMHSEEN